jgi:hypothetical protein
MQTRRGRPALQLARVQQRREVLGHLTEDASLTTRFVCLDRIPISQHFARIGHLRVAEDVRVATNQLLATVLGDLPKIAHTALLQQQREKYHLEEHVSQLVEQLGVIAVMRSIS